MLIDTDVLIWYLKGDPNAYEVIDGATGFDISVVTYMELVQCMRNKDELNRLRKALQAWNAQIIYVSEVISAKAMFYVEQHFLSHSLQLADALIGATAVTHGSPLLTGNDKHYKIIKDLQVKRFRPQMES